MNMTIVNSIICFSLPLYNIFHGREKYENVPLHKQDFVRFSDRFYWILKYSRDFFKLADVMSHFSN